MASPAPRKSSVGVEGLAGGIAGAVEALLMYPTDYVKTQMQLQRKAVAHAGGFVPPGSSVARPPFADAAARATAAAATTTTGGTATAAAKPFGGPWDVVLRTVRERGVTGLYRGLSTQIVGSIPKAATRFAAYEYFSSKLGVRSATSKSEKLRLTALAGGCAGAAEALIAVTPMETVKTQLIADQNSANPKYRGLVHGVRAMVAAQGLRGVYRGTLATTLKQSGNQMTRFVVYNALTEHIAAERLAAAAAREQTAGARGGAKATAVATGNGLTPAWTFAAGAIAGVTSVYATMPFDVVKTRLQGTDAERYGGSSVQAARHVYAEYGARGFWRGTVPRLARVAFSSSIIFTVQEYTKRWLFAGAGGGAGGGGK